MHGLRPQHLKDILGSCRDDLESYFLSSPSSCWLNLLFGASLIGLPKEDEGVTPIAIGCTLRHFAAKCVANYD